MKSTTHIVVVSQVFAPDTQSTSQLLSELVRRTAGGGARITVVTGQTATIDGVFPPRFEVQGEVQIRRTGIAANYKKSLLRRAMHYLAYIVGVAIELWRVRDADTVLGVTNPPFIPIVLWGLKKIYVRRYDLMLQDIYPEGLVAIGRLKASGLTARIWSSLNYRAYAGADRIVVLGRDMKALVQREYHVAPEKIVYLPHWSVVPPLNIVEKRNTKVAEQLGIKEKFVVQYSGNMGIWHDVISIVRCAERLRETEDIHFLFIGDGVGKRLAMQLANEKHIANISWLPFQSQEDLRDSLSCCDVALISQRAGLTGVAVPCKIYGIMAVGRAVLAMVPTGSEIDLVISEERCGLVVSPGNVDGLAAAILALKANPSGRAEMAANGFRACTARYTLAAAVMKYREFWKLDKTGEATAC